MLKKRIGILTGGGDVQPLNAVLAATCQRAADKGIEVLGFIKGWEGVLENRYVPLKKVSIDPRVGGTILKSSRMNLAKISGGPDAVLKNIHSLGLLGLIVVGGEDTLSNSLIIRDFPHVLITKTIDNDVGIMPKSKKRIDLKKIVNYFTLGYPTAAEKISKFVSLQYGLRSTAYSHERVIVVESMGMHAGWLALASSMGNPDFIIIPEFPLDYDEFKEKLTERFLRQRHAIVVVAEGAQWKNGSFIAADEKEQDDFGHPRFKGAATILANRLKEDLKSRFDTRNVNAVNPSYLYRSGSPGALDLEFGRKMGHKAVQLLAGGIRESFLLTIKKTEKKFEIRPFALSGIESMGSLHRLVDPAFYSEEEYSATKEAKRYLRYLIDEIPPMRYGVSS
jgi:6-phosphofructokinase 1